MRDQNQSYLSKIVPYVHIWMMQCFFDGDPLMRIEGEHLLQEISSIGGCNNSQYERLSHLVALFTGECLVV